MTNPDSYFYTPHFIQKGLNDLPDEGYYEAWSFQSNDPGGKNSFWLRVSIFRSENGFRRFADISAIVFERDQDDTTEKTAFRQVFDLSEIHSASDLRIGACKFNMQGTQGKLESKGRTIEWDLKHDLELSHDFNLVPSYLRSGGLIKTQIHSFDDHVKTNGLVTLDGRRIEIQDGLGILRKYQGRKLRRSWMSGHCSSFTNERGEPVKSLFRANYFQAESVKLLIPLRFKSYTFLYQDREYLFNSLWSTFKVRSEHSLNTWKFRADQGEISFQGEISSQIKDFAGLMVEDTDGSVLYNAISTLSNMRISIYRNEKLENQYLSKNTTTVELICGDKNPYIPQVL